MLEIEVKPAPGDADPAPDEGAGLAVLKPVGNCHVAIDNPHNPLPLVVVATVKLALAWVPVSEPLINKFPVVLV